MNLNTHQLDFRENRPGPRVTPFAHLSCSENCYCIVHTPLIFSLFSMIGTSHGLARNPCFVIVDTMVTGSNVCESSFVVISVHIVVSVVCVLSVGKE